jgi:hypothetical protein
MKKNKFRTEGCANKKSSKSKNHERLRNEKTVSMGDEKVSSFWSLVRQSVGHVHGAYCGHIIFLLSISAKQQRFCFLVAVQFLLLRFCPPLYHHPTVVGLWVVLSHG